MAIEFCKFCGASMPKADVTIRDGEQYQSTDYECPSCKRNNDPFQNSKNVEPSEDRDIIIRDGGSVTT